MTRKTNPETRRDFLRQLGGLTVASVVAGTAHATGLTASAGAADGAAESGYNVVPNGGSDRVTQAFNIRLNSALAQRDQALQPAANNGDEVRFPDFLASFSKGLPHNSLGIVQASAFQALRSAMESGTQAAFNAIPLGGSVKLANPQAALAYSTEGADSHHLFLPPSPTFSSGTTAAEMAEVYWRALTRDVPFGQYATNASTLAAVTDLQRFSQYLDVTPATLFRGTTPEDRIGPLISQFLLKPVPYGPTTIDQRYRVPVAGSSFLKVYSEWLSVQNGGPAPVAAVFDPTPRYLYNGRALAEWVHADFSYQGFLNAALICLGFGANALSVNNPYRTIANQGAFAQFGGPHVLDLVAKAGLAGLKAAWYQKWNVHRRLRPEEYAGRVHNHLTGAASYPIPRRLLTSTAVAAVFSAQGTYLLPMAYPEGCPTHPAYPAGHATISGACATILKAFFNEDFVIPSPVVASDDGLALNAFSGPNLTIGGECNKLAANVAHGRDTAGVHWRSDGAEGLLLGEKVAIRLLEDYRATYNETFAGFVFTGFEGKSVVV